MEEDRGGEGLGRLNGEEDRGSAGRREEDRGSAGRRTAAGAGRGSDGAWDGAEKSASGETRKWERLVFT